jgi:hypothetical protein
MEGLEWVISSQERQPAYGFPLVLLLWTNDVLRVPLGMRMWCKGALEIYAGVGVTQLYP